MRGVTVATRIEWRRTRYKLYFVAITRTCSPCVQTRPLFLRTQPWPAVVVLKGDGSSILSMCM